MNKRVQIIRLRNFHWIRMNTRIVEEAKMNCERFSKWNFPSISSYLWRTIEKKCKKWRFLSVKTSTKCRSRTTKTKRMTRLNPFAFDQRLKSNRTKSKWDSFLAKNETFRYPVIVRQSGSRRIWAKLVTNNVVSHPSFPWTTTDVSKKNSNEFRFISTCCFYLRNRSLGQRYKQWSTLLLRVITNCCCPISITNDPYPIDRYTLNKTNSIEFFFSWQTFHQFDKRFL